jgi:predicted DNA-binding transcriptional regulator AlpA
MTENLLTTRQLADRLSTSTRTLERMRQTGDGPPFVRVSSGARRGRVAYRQSQIEDWLKSRELRSTSQTPDATLSTREAA